MILGNKEGKAGVDEEGACWEHVNLIGKVEKGKRINGCSYIHHGVINSPSIIYYTKDAQAISGKTGVGFVLND
jgi:hypothetical protein